MISNIIPDGSSSSGLSIEVKKVDSAIKGSEGHLQSIRQSLKLLDEKRTALVDGFALSKHFNYLYRVL